MPGALIGLWLLIAVGHQMPMYAFYLQHDCEEALVQVRQVLWESEKCRPRRSNAWRCLTQDGLSLVSLVESRTGNFY
jgi:hypothetical protein